MTDQAADHALFDRMLTFVEEAAAIALTMRAAGLAVSHKAGDLGQALTEADLAISRMLHARFGPRLIEEETAGSLGRAEAAALLRQEEWTFIADPIDGTKPYAGGLNGWGTMIAACRGGAPEIGVLLLPAWSEPRDRIGMAVPPDQARGLLLTAFEGRAAWAPTLGGRRTEALRPIPLPTARTYHVGWLCNASKRFVLDYEQGFFPWCESGAIADAALVASGRLDATTFDHKLWDLAPALPIFKALGLRLYHWPDLAEAPAAVIDLFDERFSAHDDLWLLCRTRQDAAEFAAAIRRA
ncbi:inositol monophosphatase family protein [Methylobacterium sp. Leaf118]|uniref:inositol monophosphatase family protein n=1 Tax=Methylobacterium sp. Leaf118 TaxID=2876562 RepID=UPI001E5C3A05|nr:inositol monophosphatase family protein [Methylobacterium sp. Leaf118]